MYKHFQKNTKTQLADTERVNPIGKTEHGQNYSIRELIQRRTAGTLPNISQHNSYGNSSIAGGNSFGADITDVVSAERRATEIYNRAISEQEQRKRQRATPAPSPVEPPQEILENQNKY